MIFQGFRRFLEAIRALTSALQDIAETQRELDPALERIAKLELSRHLFEAECEGMLLKADGKLKAAASAEARERQLSKRNPDPFGDPSEEVQAAEALLPNHVAGGESPGVPAVRLALAPNNKTAAVRAKFGI